MYVCVWFLGIDLILKYYVCRGDWFNSKILGIDFGFIIINHGIKKNKKQNKKILCVLMIKKNYKFLMNYELSIRVIKQY